jgi:hypothetical protein
MKKAALILLSIAAFSCSKTNQKTTSTTSPPSTASTNTQTPMNTVSLAEAAVVGTWIYDSMVYYNNNVTYTVIPASPAAANDYTNTISMTPYSGGTSTHQMLSTYQRTSVPLSSTPWQVTNSGYTLSGLLTFVGATPLMGGYINSITSNHYVVSNSFGTVKQGDYYYFHK